MVHEKTAIELEVLRPAICVELALVLSLVQVSILEKYYTKEDLAHLNSRPSRAFFSAREPTNNP